MNASEISLLKLQAQEHLLHALNLIHHIEFSTASNVRLRLACNGIASAQRNLHDAVVAPVDSARAPIPVSCVSGA